MFSGNSQQSSSDLPARVDATDGVIVLFCQVHGSLGVIVYHVGNGKLIKGYAWQNQVTIFAPITSSWVWRDETELGHVDLVQDEAGNFLPVLIALPGQSEDEAAQKQNVMPVKNLHSFSNVDLGVFPGCTLIEPKRFEADQHAIAAGLGHQLNQFFVQGDFSLALRHPFDTEFLQLTAQLPECFRIFGHVVVSEKDCLCTVAFKPSQVTDHVIDGPSADPTTKGSGH